MGPASSHMLKERESFMMVCVRCEKNALFHNDGAVQLLSLQPLKMELQLSELLNTLECISPKLDERLFHHFLT